MGSRKTRLENEALRREQGASEAKELAAGQKDLQANTKALLDGCSANRQAMSKELLEEFRKNNRNRLNTEIIREKKAGEDKRTRTKEASENSQAVRGLLAEFHKAHVEMGDVMRQTLKEAGEKRLAAERSRQEYAGKYAGELDAYFKGVQKDTGELLSTFNTARKEMKRQQLDFLKAEEVRRLEQARQDKEARLEFFFETYDLDLGVKKKIAPAPEEEKVEVEVLPVLEKPVFLPEPEVPEVPLVPVIEKPAEELITVVPVTEAGEEAAVVSEAVEVPEAVPPAEAEVVAEEAVAKKEEGYAVEPEATEVSKDEEEQKKRRKRK